MATEVSSIVPPVYWAQRKNLLYVKIALEDCKEPGIKLDKDKLYFKGKGGVDQKLYEITLNFFNGINPEESKFVVRDRGTEFVLIKAEDAYWARLLKEKVKNHWLKVDFNKWKDEDESDDEMGGGGGGTDFEEMMKQMGGLGGGAELGDLEGDADSDDDADLPDLQKKE